MTELSEFTREELAREAEREVAMRRSVYPHQVAAGKFKPDIAERRIAMMQAIADVLRDSA